jgi:hypothetical protein
MQIAIVQNNTITAIGEHTALFPNVSFPASGLDPEWMKEQGVVPVTYFKEYDRATQRLTSVDPYIEGESVFAVTVEALSAEEVTALADAAKTTLLKQYEMATQAKLDSVAKEKDYNSIEDAASYANSTNTTWAAEAQAAIAWRDAVWADYYDLVEKVNVGEEAIMDVSGFIDSLPVINW